LAFEQLAMTFISRGSVLILLVPFWADFYKGIYGCSFFIRRYYYVIILIIFLLNYQIV